MGALLAKPLYQPHPIQRLARIALLTSPVPLPVQDMLRQLTFLLPFIMLPSDSTSSALSRTLLETKFPYLDINHQSHPLVDPWVRARPRPIMS